MLNYGKGANNPTPTLTRTLALAVALTFLRSTRTLALALALTFLRSSASASSGPKRWRPEGPCMARVTLTPSSTWLGLGLGLGKG